MPGQRRNRLTVTPNERIQFKDAELGELIAHVFEEDAIEAVHTAIAARRPLLVRGEPGTGKSQLARAVAHKLGRVLISKVVDAHTEARDLFWSFDAVGRLARAQMLGALNIDNEQQALDELDERKFLHPGPLWWAFNWETARDHAMQVGCSLPDVPDGKAEEWPPERGAVVLLDEIDKADPALPNGLLEALGSGTFDVRAHGRVYRKDDPFIIVTTNEERELPDAFLRRCLVLHLELPRKREKLVEWLVERGRAHFHDRLEEVYEPAAALLFEDRAYYKGRGLVAPGQAEYLDLLRALDERRDETSPAKLLETIAKFTLRKHPPEYDASGEPRRGHAG